MGKPASRPPSVLSLGGSKRFVCTFARSFVRSRGDAGCEDGEPTSLSHYLSLSHSSCLELLPRASGLFDLGGVDQSFRQSIHDMLSVSPSLSLCCFPPSLGNLATFGCASGRPSATGPAVEEGLLCLLGSRNFLRDPFDKMFTQRERATHLLSSGASQNFYPLPLSLPLLRLRSAEKVPFPLSPLRSALLKL